jgi:hypothetical protein
VRIADRIVDGELLVPDGGEHVGFLLLPVIPGLSFRP